MPEGPTTYGRGTVKYCQGSMQSWCGLLHHKLLYKEICCCTGSKQLCVYGQLYGFRSPGAL